MLDLGRYLLGVVEILLLVGFSWLGGNALRAWLLPRFEGAPAHLATVVIALALLIWSAELLGTFGALTSVPYLLLVTVLGVCSWAFLPRVASWRGSPAARSREGGEHRGGGRDDRTRGPVASVPTLIALTIAAIAVVHFALEAKTRLSTGMTGFDSTWYHGPFTAGFFQSGDTWDLHFIAPQFLAWFYPANSELFHSIGMFAFGRDILSPLLNLGWFVGCLAACWCIGRPYRVAPWSLGLGAVALSVPALADQAGEARNDIVGIFFLLAAVAIALNAWGGRQAREGLGRGSGAAGLGPNLIVGLAAGLAAGTKLNFLLPAGVLVLGLVAVAPRGARWRALVVSGLAALAGGGYWYLRNLAHTGNPLPWIDSLGPISLPAPDQALGGREAHSVLGYLFDGAVWSDWLLPGLHDGLWIVWPLLVGAALAGLILCLASANRWDLVPDSGTKSKRSDPVLAVVALAGLAASVAWLVAPTSASGPEGMPRGFESGLRYLAPALVLGLALAPVALSKRLSCAGQGHPPNGRILKAPSPLARRLSGRGVPLAGATAALVLVVAIGYPIQRHYLENRYADPSFTTPGLTAAFAWSRDVTGSRIATTSTRQYPLFGTDLSNQVQFIGKEQPHGGFKAPATCRAWRKQLNAGDYGYVVASRDRIEPGKSPYPPQAGWTEGLGAKPILKKPPTVVFKLSDRLDPSDCR
jgi:hypothetical protein